MFISIIVGLLLNILSFVYTLVTVKHSLKQEDWDDFIWWYSTTTAIKFIVLIILLLVFIFVIELDKLYLLLSFFISYILFLFFEIIYLNKTKSFSKFATENKNKAK
jgi:F0F1-type ATP synthase assembly protein I